MDINYLRVAAEELASCEIRVRQTAQEIARCEKSMPKKRLFGPNKEEKAFLARYEDCRREFAVWEERRKRCLEQAERLRRQITEASGREFWWDVPFDPAAPPASVPESFAFPKGFYLDLPPLDILAGPGISGMIAPERKPSEVTPAHIEAMGELPEDFLMLYSDSGIVEDDDLMDELLTLRTICNMETPLTQRQITTTGPDAWTDPFPESASGGQQELRQRMEAFEAHYDRVERALNMLGDGMALTNREKAAAGGLSLEELMEQEIWRSNARIAAMEKEQEKQHKDEMLQKFLRQQAYEANRKTISISGENLIRYSAVAGAAFMGEKLVGLWIPKLENAFLEFSCEESMTPDRFEGKFYSSRLIMKGQTDTAPLLAYLARRYGAYMGPHDVLAPRPAGASDGEWRLWAETRWEWTLSLEG